MNETVTVEVTTQVFGLGSGKRATPTWVALPERTVALRTLIAEHVRNEIVQAEQHRSSSIALHYILADDLRSQPRASAVDIDTEIKRAWDGLTERRYVVLVDGVALDDLDAPVSLMERSLVSFVRLLPLVGG